MTLSYVSLLPAAAGATTSGTFDAGLPQTSVSLVATATAAAFSVQLQASADAAAWSNAGSAVTSAGTTPVTVSSARYFRVALTGYTGPGTVTVQLGYTPAGGYTGGGGGGGGAPSGSAGGDLGGTYPNPTVTATHLASALPVAQGGTGQASAANALNALGGAAVAGDIGGTSASPQVTGSHFAAPLAVVQGGTGSATQNWSGLLTPTGVKTSAYTAAPGDLVPVDTTSGAVPITLTAAPADLARIAVRLVKLTVPNAATITAGGSDVFSIAGGTSTSLPPLTVLGQTVELQYKASTGIWYPQGDAAPGIPDTSTLWPGTARLPVVPQPAAVVTAFQAGHGWTGLAGGTYTLNDTTAGNFCSGSQAASMTTDGSGTNYATIRNLGGYNLNATACNLRLRFKLDDITHLSQINVFAGSSSLSNYYKWIVYVPAVSTYITSGDWIVLTLSWIDPATHNTPNRAALTDVEVQVLDDGAGTVTSHWQSVELVPDGTATFPKGVVSICWDDGYSSPMTTGAWSTLDSYGLPATMCVITDQLGAFPYVALSDLKTRCDLFGWECAGHAMTGLDHNSSDTGLSSAQLDADARQQRAWLTSNGLRGGDGYAYPLGNFGQTTDGKSVVDILRRYYSWNRTVSSFVHETWPPADRFRLRGISNISSFGAGITATAVNALLDSTVTYGGWQILIFHRIVTGSPAAVTECTLTDFNAIIAHLASTGIPVMTVGDALRHYSQEIPGLPLPVASGGTAHTTAAAAYNALSPMTTLGDIEYESAPGVASRLAGNTTTTKKFLTQTGNGTISAAPAYATVETADLAGLIALYYKPVSGITPSATISTFGTAVTVTPDAGFTGITISQVNFVTTGLATETITVQSVTTYSDNSTGTQSNLTTFTTNTTTNASIGTMIAMIGSGADGKGIKSVAFQVKSTIANSAASLTINLVGVNLP